MHNVARSTCHENCDITEQQKNILNKVGLKKHLSEFWPLVQDPRIILMCKRKHRSDHIQSRFPIC